MKISYKDYNIYHINYNNVVEVIRAITEHKDCDYFLITSPEDKLNNDYISTVMNRCGSVDPLYGFFYTDFVDEYTRMLPSFHRMKMAKGLVLPKTGLYKKIVFDVCGMPDPKMKNLWYYDIQLRIGNKFLLYHIAESLYSTKLPKINQEELNEIIEKHSG